jgi:hypothetical protein
MKRLILACSLALAGCGSSAGTPADATPGDGPASDGGLPSDGAASVEQALASLPPWSQPPAAKDTPTALPDETRALKIDGQNQAYSCKVTKHDIIANHDEVLNFSIGAEYVLPGLLLQGGPFQRGELAPIPLAAGKRAPIDISINLAATENPTERVTDPSSATIRSAITKLQQRAKVAAGGNFAATVAYSKKEVQSMEQLFYALNVDLQYDGPFTDVGFQAAFTDQQTQRKHTVVAELQQDMYTISFAHDEFMRSSDFFTPAFTPADVAGLERDDTVGPDNLPVFVSTVTYGRTIVFTATSTEVESARDIEQALEVSYDSTLGGSGSVDEAARMASKAVLHSLEIKVLALGGNSGDVTGAIQTGEWDKLFANPDILSAVPLRYVVRNLSGSRPVARLGDTTSFTISECSPVVSPAAASGWLPVESPPGVEFVDLSSHNEEVWAIGHAGASYAPYHLEAGKMVAAGTTDVRSLAVDGESTVWGLDATGNLLRRISGNWAPVLQPGTATPFNFLYLDAGGGPGAVTMNHTYGSDGSRDFFWVHALPVPPGLESVYLMDDAQYVPDDTFTAVAGAVLYVDSADDTWLRRCPLTGCGRRQGATIVHTDRHIKKVSAVSESLALIVDGDGKLEELNGTTFTPLPDASQPTVTPVRIEADPGRKHWLIAPDSRIYRFAPP